MDKEQSFGNRVWRGDRSTVREALERFVRDPDRQLLPYASVLYSFRHIPAHAAELEELHGELQERARSLIVLSGVSGGQVDIANEMDMIATYLRWLSYRRVFGFPARISFRKQAWEVAERGYWVAESFTQPYHIHTPLLLLLTQAELLLGENLHARAERLLRQVARSAPQVSDPNQQARVYRKLGMLYRKDGWYGGRPSLMYYGFWWMLRAIFVRGIPLKNRLKSIAALAGFSS